MTVEAPHAPRRYLIISDLHFSDLEDHTDGWRSYKHPRYATDEAFCALLDDFEREAVAKGEAPVLILNGDIFDFDLVSAIPESPPWPVNGNERRRGLRPTPEKSAWKMDCILRDHTAFIDRLARFLGHGHQVVYVLGNHDRELHFEVVEARLREALSERSRALGFEDRGASLQIEPWFFYIPGEIYAEHGQQYDDYTCFRYVLAPTVQFLGEEHIALPMGNLSNRYLLTLMGYFNPHATDYILSLQGYVAHWLRHYAFTRRSLVFNWFFGSFFVLYRLLGYKKNLLKQPADYAQRLDAKRRQFGLTSEQMEGLLKLQKKPITQRLFRMVREFWIDRVILTAGLVIATLLIAFSDVSIGLKIMTPLTAFPLTVFIYERLAEGETVFTAEHRFPDVARQIGELLAVPIVTFGHTHSPRMVPVAEGVSFIDSGAWAPILDVGGSLRPGFRNYAVVHSGDEVTLRSYRSELPRRQDAVGSPSLAALRADPGT